MTDVAAASCGGMSFTAGTKVLLASGAAIPISKLKPGEKVLATDTRTGKNHAKTITAVLVHYDRDLYDLKIRSGSRTTVIDTTSNHLFWVPGTHRWVKAAALRHGTRLRTPGGSNAAVLDGYVPRQRRGWMWDLTIPGDHDFYIDTVATPVLVHNCSAGPTRTVQELSEARPIHGLNEFSTARVQSLDDRQLLDAVNNPSDGEYVTLRTTDNAIMQGHHRIAELISRAADSNSIINATAALTCSIRSSQELAAMAKYSLDSVSPQVRLGGRRTVSG